MFSSQRLKTHRTQTAGEMRGEIVLEVVLQQFGLDDVVEAQLTHGDEDGPGAGPVGSVEQLPEAFLPANSNQSVDGVFVAKVRYTHLTYAPTFGWECSHWTALILGLAAAAVMCRRRQSGSKSFDFSILNTCG